MLEEQWVPVEGYPNYEVSNYGRVVNVKTGRDLRVKYGVLSDIGRVTLYLNGRTVSVEVAKIVAKAFFLNYQDHSKIYYRNGNESDCSVLNLSLDPHVGLANKLARLRQGDKISFIDMTEKEIVQVIIMAQKIREALGIA